MKNSRIIGHCPKCIIEKDGEFLSFDQDVYIKLLFLGNFIDIDGYSWVSKVTNVSPNEDNSDTLTIQTENRVKIYLIKDSDLLNVLLYKQQHFFILKSTDVEPICSISINEK